MAVGPRVNDLKERAAQVFLIALAVRTCQELSDDDATHMAAGVAYYTLFSLFPLLLGLIALLGLFLDAQHIQTRLNDFASDYLPGSEQLVKSNIDAVLGLRGALGLFAVIGLFWSGSAIFGAISRSVNRAWDVQKNRPVYIDKPRQMAMALAVGILFLASLSSATLARVAGTLAKLEIPGMEFLVTTSMQLIFQG